METNQPHRANPEFTPDIDLTPEMTRELLRATTAPHDAYRRVAGRYVRPITPKLRMEITERIAILAQDTYSRQHAEEFERVVGRPTVVEVDEKADKMTPLERYRCAMTPERTVLAIEQLALYNGAVFQPEVAATICALLGRPTIVPVHGEMSSAWAGYPLLSAAPQHEFETPTTQKPLARVGAYIISRLEKLFGVQQSMR